jgi:hypothetical protein
MSARRSVLAVLVALLAQGASAPQPIAAQKLLPMALGTAAGFGAGGFISIGIVTLQARRGNYIYYATDALGWQSAPIVAGGITGLALGALDEERLKRSVIVGAIGGFAGAAIGLTYGALSWPPPEGEWAGTVIGAAAGLAAGALLGMVMPVSSTDETATDGSTAARPRGTPLVIRIPF